ncbi:MAG: twin-arginine translocase TatA/TatE family subunit [Acidobacteria bacterium]|nr:twin-arginine translocase TatA/TatE family subunit [Acidobacteriota bacterium]
MGSIGMPELMIIFVVALIVFGPRKLPNLGRSLGQGLAEFRKATNQLRSTIDDHIKTIDSEPPHPTEDKLDPPRGEDRPAG